MEPKKALFISIANLKSSDATIKNDLQPYLQVVAKDKAIDAFRINNLPITYTTFRFLQRNIRFCCRALFYLYSPQASLPYFFPKPDYPTMEIRLIKALNLINEKMNDYSPLLHRKVVPAGARSVMSSRVFRDPGGRNEYSIHLHLRYPDFTPLPFDSFVYLSLAQFLENPDNHVIVRCAYKKCTNYFLTTSAHEFTCQEFPFGDSCLHLLKKQTSAEQLGAKIRK